MVKRRAKQVSSALRCKKRQAELNSGSSGSGGGRSGRRVKEENKATRKHQAM